MYIENNIKYLFALSLLMACFISCQQNIKIVGFEHEKWKNDKQACLSVRKAIFPELMKNKDLLKGYDEKAIAAYLGKPDETELYSRNQKFFIYYIEPAKQCTDPNNSERPKSLFIRFSALNVSNEIFVKGE
ncbi:hypothetical protein QQ008_19705 [Fulvivirgaceae bacterium BMA10]|uniref:Lipoprotein n=1 Tax=Splendidivirga corallicola TaxID=3051826 RepID=A0ABT8KTV8_9BACT|nr:hypothetical protein [Fulvivirgaceae bacterium BMA10]